MMENIIKILITTFIVSSMFACIEDKEVCTDAGKNALPDGKERIELRLIVPVGTSTDARRTKKSSTGENGVNNIFMDIMKEGTVVASCSTTDGTLILSATKTDSVYVASAIFDIGVLESGYTIRVRANEDFPQVITERPVGPFFMSGMGRIEKTTDYDFMASVHLLRGVAKLRTAVRTTSLSVPREDLKIGDVKVQVIHVADKIRRYAPFPSHAFGEEYVYENQPASYFNYFDYPETSLADVELKENVDMGGEKVTFSSWYVYENYLEDLSDYNPDTNVTSINLTIPVTDGVTNRIIKRTIPVRTEGSYQMKRNHIYSIDVQVLSLDEVKIFTDMFDWTDIDISGDITGTDFDIDRREIALIKDIDDPVKLVQVRCNTTGRLGIKVLKANQTTLMSTNDLQLYCDGITGTHQVTNNYREYDVAALQTMNFYCTTGSVPENFDGGFIEITADNVRKELIPISSLTTFTPLDMEGTSNCYIADRGGKSYSFTATVMGNGVDGIIDNGEFEDAMGNKLAKVTGADILPLSAKLLWQDTDELVEQVALVDNRVQVKMGRSRGNAVIAVYDNVNPNAVNAKILWSWHLWCTATPGLITYSASRYTGNEYKVMDRNLGATTATGGLGTTQGLSYQWGRKDPYSGSLSYDGKRTVLYDIRSAESEVEYSKNEPATIGQTINTPHICNMGTSDTYSWCKDNDMYMKYLWGNPTGTDKVFPQSTSKTIYDPCPVGYKVAPGDVFQVLAKTDWVSTHTDIAYYFYIKNRYSHGSSFYCDGTGTDEAKVIYLPEVYLPNWAAGDLSLSGKYWASSLYGEKKAFTFTFTLQGSYMLPVNRRFADVGSVRCIKE